MQSSGISPIHFQKLEETIGKIRSTIDCNVGNLLGYRLLNYRKTDTKRLLGLLSLLFPRPPQEGRQTAMAVAAAYDKEYDQMYYFQRKDRSQ